MDSLQKTHNSGAAMLVMAIALGVLAIVAILAYVQKTTVSAGVAGSKETQHIEESAVQAVFLTDGQVYFGDIASIDGSTVVLEHVFYLQADQELQPGGDQAAAAQNENPPLSLAKLGLTELHKPQDRMLINRDQVLFWENLQEDSKVVQAIRGYTPPAQ